MIFKIGDVIKQKDAEDDPYRWLIIGIGSQEYIHVHRLANASYFLDLESICEVDVSFKPLTLEDCM